MACPMVPSGRVPTRLLDDAQQVVVQGTLMISPGAEHVFIATYDQATMMPTIMGGVFLPQFKCATSNPLVPIDGGMMTPADAGAGN